MVAVAAAFSACAVWVLIPGSSSRRARRLLAPTKRTRGQVSPEVLLLGLPPLAMLFFGPAVGLIGGFMAALLLHRWLTSRLSPHEIRRRAEMKAGLPRALLLLVAALDAGRPPLLALHDVAGVSTGHLAAELKHITYRLDVAADPHLVWQQVGADPLLAVVGRAFVRADETGMPVSKFLSQAAADLTREQHAAIRERARKVGVKTAAPLGLCFLPAFFLVGIAPIVIGLFFSMR